MVSAFAARQRLVLAPVKVNEKSKEIAAIPALLGMTATAAAAVTTGAMGCQRHIAAKIIGKKADCILALQRNQGRPREEVEIFATERKTRGFADAAAGTRQTFDADHGRIETRNYTVIHDVGWQRERHEWPGLKGLLTVESQREFD